MNLVYFFALFHHYHHGNVGEMCPDVHDLVHYPSDVLILAVLDVLNGRNNHHLQKAKHLKMSYPLDPTLFVRLGGFTT